MELSTLLSEALSPDQHTRNQAEVNIDMIASQNFGMFLLNCSKELCDESRLKGIRQIASTIIKNMVSHTPKYKGQWELLNRDMKSQIKQNVLSTLASSEKDIRKAAGIAVAGICKTELPLGEWNEIIEVLCQTSQNQNNYIQLASVLTLGYITQEITTRDLNDEHVCQILSAYYQILNFSNDTELQAQTVISLLNFIPFTKRIFENKDQKNLFLEMILKHTKNTDVNIRKGAIHCLLEIGRSFYDHLEENIPGLLSVTAYSMANDEESVAILTYEFWCSIGDIEIGRLQTRNTNLPCRQYCNRAYSQLLEVIYPHLLLISSNNEEDSWTLSKAASCLLSILSQCCEYELIQSVINFIGSNINQANSFTQEASILAFGAILDTSHKDNMSNLVINSVDTLMTFMLDPNSKQSIKDTTSWVIEKISELYGENFIKHLELFEKLYLNILNLLMTSKKKIVCHLCNSIHFLSLAFKPVEGQNSSILSKHLKNSFDTLLKLAFTSKSYDSEHNVAMSAFYAIGSLIEHSAPDTKFYIQGIFQELLEAFKSTLEPKYFENDKMRHDYQAYIATCLECCLISGKLMLNFEASKEILNLIIHSFKERNTVYEEGLMAASSIALAIGPAFDSLVNDFGSYLIYSLNSTKDTALCKTGIHSTSDLIRSIGPNFSKYLDQIVPIILNILADREADKILKPNSFNVISDIFVVCLENAFKYFNEIMDLIGSALEAATFLPEDKEDFENLEYFESLREHIIECLTCIFHTVRDLNKDLEFKKYVEPIVVFINQINTADYCPTTELTKSSLALLADFCDSYKAEMKPIINVKIVEEMIIRLKMTKSNKISKIISWAQKLR